MGDSTKLWNSLYCTVSVYSKLLFFGSVNSGSITQAYILASFPLHCGIYVGRVGYALYSKYIQGNSHTVISKSRTIGRVMLPIIILLYITTTINFSFNWTLSRLILFRSTLSTETFHSQWGPVEMLATGVGITAVISTVVADCTMVCATFAVRIAVNLML